MHTNAETEQSYINQGAPFMNPFGAFTGGGFGGQGLWYIIAIIVILALFYWVKSNNDDSKNDMLYSAATNNNTTQHEDIIEKINSQEKLALQNQINEQAAKISELQNNNKFNELLSAMNQQFSNINCEINELKKSNPFCRGFGNDGKPNKAL